MSAIVLCSTPPTQRRKHPDYGIEPADWMPMATRIKLGREINRAWEEFVNEMHDGTTTGPVVAEKFIKYLASYLTR